MAAMFSGKAERLPYSLSRWTDVPAAKWSWFEQQLDQGWMVGFDPRTAIPGKWSLAPEDTYGLVFWTKVPANLIEHAERLKQYPLVIHVTATAWSEVEKGAPDLNESIGTMYRTIEAFGAENVVWRFSPVPLVEDVIERFEELAASLGEMGLKQVYVSFLQENDLMPETRSPRVRKELLKRMASSSFVKEHSMVVKLCAEDRLLANELFLPKLLCADVCEDGTRFMSSNFIIERPKTEGCGCALAVDPFTINESCTLGCSYCYAADKELAPRKRNTTKRQLTVVR